MFAAGIRNVLVGASLPGWPTNEFGNVSIQYGGRTFHVSKRACTFSTHNVTRFQLLK
jgi:hypothetical protein